ncbi:hypothetical protein CK203_052308 [Vitis vinifera]|uniref:Retrovirus-related Pol polyprotein from transposon RE1 n=1 Tax=Vitis vinifera TaxID=29760 RepID=A0A438FWD3_VITVI|nr:hypothetical protein CK203_052308 [Vitis vinifera]
MICWASLMAQLLVLPKPSCNLVLQHLSPTLSASYGNDKIISFSMPFLHQSHGLLLHLSPLQHLLMKHAIKIIIDDLALMGYPLSEDEIILYVLNGLGNDFKEISAAIRAKDSPVTFEELHDKLQDQETLLKQDNTSRETPPIIA